MHLTDKYSNPACPEDAENYERVCKHFFKINITKGSYNFVTHTSMVL